LPFTLFRCRFGVGRRLVRIGDRLAVRVRRLCRPGGALGGQVPLLQKLLGSAVADVLLAFPLGHRLLPLLRRHYTTTGSERVRIVFLPAGCSPDATSGGLVRGAGTRVRASTIAEGLDDRRAAPD
jgi:hypothetical protein